MAKRALDRSLGLLELPLFVSVVFLQGCPLSDNYYIDSELDESAGRGGAFGSGGTLGSGGAFGTGGTFGGARSTGGSAGGVGTCYAEVRAGKDYLFCTNDELYATAETTCADAGMSLVLIDDAAEDDWVWQTIDRLYTGTQPFAFIGADDRASEGEWFFADGVQFWSGAAGGVAVGSRYFHWAVQQPNNLSPVTQTQEDCGAIVLAEGAWGDVRCELDCPFVCEAP